MSDRPAASPDAASPDTFEALVQRALADASFVRLVLAGNRVAGSDLRRVTVRAISLRGAPALSFVHSHGTRDVTRNEGIDEGLASIRELLAGTFAHAHLTTRAELIELRISRKGKRTVRRSALAGEPPPIEAGGDADPARAHGRALPAGASSVPSDAASRAQPGGSSGPPPAVAAATHDRPKHRFVDITRPYLVELGVTDAAHRLVPALARKWKQINKFVEIFDHALRGGGLLESAPIRVADFGSGKGYLTFAVHDHLRSLGIEARTVGVELRPDLVALCNGIAERTGLAGLSFVEGDLRSHQPDALDVMIALHACDTATDHAIHLGIQAGARVILCSPCCHKELRPQLRSPLEVAPMLRHGVHLGQQAEMVTDSLRALLLERAGYEAQVFEFVALEHTSKNKMILAVRRAPGAEGRAAAAAVEINRIKQFYGVREQRLEQLLVGSGSR
ncbi:class I SAM-dependent methyltransferase [Piscinibacter koreensis]|uniref:SAM-dependent methyltransferase n=1 Tax=Piscinibacter koreensis TaxID=2742824 RepID=A0A7Y6NJL5_9BURK|nr:SAM-dependent methyltransferase [Schlegelella koreensis]NUZ04380.1 SAM-dependent methyltransferase [Schlegelella koreensis]